MRLIALLHHLAEPASERSAEEQKDASQHLFPMRRLLSTIARTMSSSLVVRTAMTERECFSEDDDRTLRIVGVFSPPTSTVRSWLQICV